MTFVFQQPGTARLLEAINTAAENATSGGGVFAFASKGGVDAFFESPRISDMLTRGNPFHLIVGIDAITNPEALLRLSEKVAQFPETLTVNVFYHEEPSSTFHPKFSWFKHVDGISLVTGSGNLTLRGLGQMVPRLGNWEAFSVQKLNGEDSEHAHREIDEWIRTQRAEGTLCALDDEQVREKAMTNGQVRFSVGVGRARDRRLEVRAPEVADGELQTEITEDETEGAAFEILIRELPRTRPGQGDVGQNAHNAFFGHNGVDKHIFLQYVGLDNVLNTVHSVWLFYNPASDNYRLELSGKAGMEYETSENDDRMVLIASKLGPRSFRYSILLPMSHHEHYEKIRPLLGPIRPRRRLMREALVSPDTLMAAWPEIPSNLLPIILPTSEP